jgi:hypothetical protein
MPILPGLQGSAPRLIKNNLILHLDPNSKASYPGSGTVWYDLSGRNNNFNILATAYNSTGPKYMDFNGSYGMAKNTSNITLSGNVTYCLWTRVKAAGDWRTLTRGYGGDHHVIIEYNSNKIGMYDNDGAAFVDSGALQSNIPGNGTSTWAFLHFRFSTSSPYYQVSWNDTPSTIRGSSTNIGSSYTRGFGAIGGYHAENTDPSSGSQFWGDIGLFLTYNKVLSNDEILQNYNATKGRFGL